MELLDVQCGFGTAPGQRQPVTAADLCDEMERIGVGAGLVRLTPPTLHFDIAAGNAALYAVHDQSPALIPCPVVIPDAAHDLPSNDAQAAEAVGHGAGAVCIRPRTDCWSLAPWASDGLFRALSARRLPVLCSSDEVPLEELGGLAGRHRGLPLVILGANYRQQRILAPLLEHFPNTYLSIGSNYCVHHGIEALVGAVGPTRLLFGTGFPDVDMLPTVTYLSYADIPDDAKRLIGAGNLRRLMREVVR